MDNELVRSGSDLQTAHSNHYVADEATRQLRRMVTLLIHQQELTPRISVISALRSEGVTYVSTALAALLAVDLSARVCLVDLNWWSPSFNSRLPRRATAQHAPGKGRWFFSKRAAESGSLPAQPAPAGLADVLYERLDLSAALVDTVIPSLSLLPPGELAERERARVCRSQALRDLIAHVSRRFDYTIFDVPAILRTSDAIPLASLGDACCLVIRQGVTPVNRVQQALDEVKHVRMLGAILNRVQIHTPPFVRQFIPEE